MPDYYLPKYRGGKKRMAHKIVELLPPSNHYFEPFAGLAAVMLAHPKRPHELLNDADGRIFTWWRMVRDEPVRLRNYLRATPHARAALSEANDVLADIDAHTEIQVAAAVAATLSMGLHGALPEEGKRTTMFEAPSIYHATGRLINTSDIHWVRIADELPKLAERMRGVCLESGDGVELVERYAVASECLIYCDPPYADTSGYAEGCDYERMADACRTAKANIAISGSPGCPWDDLLGWERVDLTTVRREKGSGHGGATGHAKECLWVNYPVPARLPFG